MPVSFPHNSTYVVNCCVFIGVGGISVERLSSPIHPFLGLSNDVPFFSLIVDFAKDC